MGGECSEGSCESKSCGSACESSCPCGTSGCSGDPLECATGMWSGSFFQAMKAVQVDILKSKLQKAWGAKMEKAADAVLESMQGQWQAMLAQSQAKSGLRERLQSLWQEGK